MAFSAGILELREKRSKKIWNSSTLEMENTITKKNVRKSQILRDVGRWSLKTDDVLRIT